MFIALLFSALEGFKFVLVSHKLAEVPHFQTEPGIPNFLWRCNAVALGGKVPE